MKLDLERISSGVATTQLLNDNSQEIENAIENTLSRDGTSPNQMEANLDMNSNSILNTNTVYTSSLYINGVLVTPDGLTFSPTIGKSHQAFTATAGQTVFNLGFTYTQGLNQLMVHVNGVYQEPFVSWTESSTSSITFTSGLEAGDLVTVLANLSDPVTYEFNTAVTTNSLDPSVTLTNNEATGEGPALLADPRIVVQDVSAAATKTIIDSNDMNLGAEATTESAALHLGSLRTGTGFSLIDFNSNTQDVANGWGGRIIRSNTATNANMSYQHNGTGFVNFQNFDAAGFRWYTSNVERIRLTSAGDLGLGTSTPTRKLEISDTNESPARIVSTAATSYIRFVASGTTAGATEPKIGGFNNDIYIAPNGTASVVCAASGDVGIGETVPDYKLDVNGTIGFTPGTSVTPADNGDVVFELTNNTTLTVKARGTDGVVRSATLTLA